jgi:hypothetical protein
MFNNNRAMVENVAVPVAVVEEVKGKEVKEVK